MAIKRSLVFMLLTFVNAVVMPSAKGEAKHAEIYTSSRQSRFTAFVKRANLH